MFYHVQSLINEIVADEPDPKKRLINFKYLSLICPMPYRLL